MNLVLKLFKFHRNLFKIKLESATFNLGNFDKHNTEVEPYGTIDKERKCLLYHHVISF